MKICLFITSIMHDEFFDYVKSTTNTRSGSLKKKGKIIAVVGSLWLIAISLDKQNLRKYLKFISWGNYLHPIICKTFLISFWVASHKLSSRLSIYISSFLTNQMHIHLQNEQK